MAASLRVNLTGEDLESCPKCRDDLSAGILGGAYMYKYFFPVYATMIFLVLLLIMKQILVCMSMRRQTYHFLRTQ